MNTFAFSFDAVGNLLGAPDDLSEYNYAYDALNRVTSLDNIGTPAMPQFALTTIWDAIGNRTAVSATVNSTADFTNSYTHDALGRTTSVQQSGGGADKRVDVAYNAAGQFTSIERYEDLYAGTLVAETAFGYNAAGWLTDIDHFQGATPFNNYDYTHDAAGRITQIVSIDGTSNYSYTDGLGVPSYRACTPIVGGVEWPGRRADLERRGRTENRG